MKRSLAILLVAVLLIGLMPMTGALAATEYATVVGGVASSAGEGLL